MACTPKYIRRLRKKLFITPAEARRLRKSRGRGIPVTINHITIWSWSRF